MAKVITQETFDEVVRENMEEFSMSTEEATEDAVKQFEAQGIDLSNIIKDLTMSQELSDTIKNSLKTLEDLVTSKSKNPQEINAQLNKIKEECNKGLQQRVLIGKAKGYDIIFKALMRFEENDSDLLKTTLRTMLSLMTGQPDLLDDNGIELIIRLLASKKDEEIIQLVMKWVKECCTKHEMNRQKIFNAKILDHLKSHLNGVNAATLRTLCGVLRSLVLDDDIRVEFGQAHEHARVIASDTLCPIIELLSKFKKDENVVNELLVTLSTLLVRNEFCKKVEDAGGLDFVLETLQNFEKNEKLNRQSLKLLKVLAGNDECRAHIIQKGGAPIIAKSILNHKKALQNAIAGLNVIAALALRNPENSKNLYESGFPEIIVEVLKLHKDEMKVQKTGSWAIRNMVSRSRYQSEKFLSLGAEEILQQSLKKFKKDCEYDVKAALRDLGCKVDLKEEWTGKGGKITTQEKNPIRE